MRQGFFPGQLEALRELARDGLELHEYRRKSRRAFVALGLGAIGLGVGAFFVGRGLGSAAADDAGQVPAPGGNRWQAKLAWAEEFAQRPIEELAARRSTFLMTIEQTGGSEATWKGFARLAEFALGAQPNHRDLLLRLSEVVANAPPPDWLNETLLRIEAELRRR